MEPDPLGIVFREIEISVQIAAKSGKGKGSIGNAFFNFFFTPQNMYCPQFNLIAGNLKLLSTLLLETKFPAATD